MFVYLPKSHVSHTYIRLSDQTGRTDIPLTECGEEQIKSKAQFLVGDGSTIDSYARCFVVCLIALS
jgi:broad specificity phosphatase PhoE